MDLADSRNKFVLCLSVLRVCDSVSIKNLKLDKTSVVFGMKTNTSRTFNNSSRIIFISAV